MSRSSSQGYPPYYETYLQNVDFKQSIVENLERSRKEARNLLTSLPKTKENYAYAAGKWTVKEVVQHCIDTERVFVYRALRFARNDQTELAGYDEVAYGEQMNCEQLSLAQLTEEFDRLRASSIDFYNGLSSVELARTGTASQQLISVEAIGYILSGHLLHHLNIIRGRYLN